MMLLDGVETLPCKCLLKNRIMKTETSAQIIIVKPFNCHKISLFKIVYNVLYS